MTRYWTWNRTVYWIALESKIWVAEAWFPRTHAEILCTEIWWKHNIIKADFTVFQYNKYYYFFFEILILVRVVFHRFYGQRLGQTFSIILRRIRLLGIAEFYLAEFSSSAPSFLFPMLLIAKLGLKPLRNNLESSDGLWALLIFKIPEFCNKT